MRLVLPSWADVYSRDGCARGSFASSAPSWQYRAGLSDRSLAVIPLLSWALRRVAANRFATVALSGKRLRERGRWKYGAARSIRVERRELNVREIVKLATTALGMAAAICRRTCDDRSSLHVRDRHREQLSRPSRTAACASTRWRSAAITSTGAPTSICVEELGIRFLRYGPPLHRTWLGPGRYDWEFADLTFGDLLPARHHRRSSTSATSACRTGSATSRTPTFPRCSPTTPAPSRERFPLGPALHAGQRDVHLRHVLGRATAGGTSS